MTGNADGTKMQQTLNNSETVSPNPQQNGEETRVHIAGVTGSSPVSPTKHSNDLDPKSDQKNSSLWSKGTAERFWSHVAIGPPDKCWPWKCSSGRDGYGQVTIAGQNKRSHRVAFMLATGSDPAALYVCHKCDNPICCNPSHLYAGTHSDNERDKTRRNRVSYEARRNRAGKLGDERVRQIREAINSGQTNIAIGLTFGVHHSTVSLIRSGRTWKGV